MLSKVLALTLCHVERAFLKKQRKHHTLFSHPFVKPLFLVKRMSAVKLAVSCYKRMRLTTSAYGMYLYIPTPLISILWREIIKIKVFPLCDMYLIKSQRKLAIWCDLMCNQLCHRFLMGLSKRENNPPLSHLSSSLVPRLSRNASMYRRESLVFFLRKYDVI